MLETIIKSAIGAAILAIALYAGWAFYLDKKKPDETIPLDFLGESKTNTDNENGE